MITKKDFKCLSLVQSFTMNLANVSLLETPKTKYHSMHQFLYQSTEVWKYLKVKRIKLNYMEQASTKMKPKLMKQTPFKETSLLLAINKTTKSIQNQITLVNHMCQGKKISMR